MSKRGATPGLARAVRTGERIFLRHPTGADKAEWVRLRDDSELHLRPWEPTLPGETEMAPSEIAFEKLLASSNIPEAQRYVICLTADGQIIGQLSFNQIFRGPFQNAIAGYWIGEAHARRGYMSEALHLGLTHVFESLKLHRVEANIIPANRASKGLVKKLGFRFEGLAKRYLRIDGAWRDHEHWAMTVEDWDELQCVKGRKAERVRSTPARKRGR